ncbi:hypothetical protein ACS0TY_009028 [Phlomoides rotata]
MKFVTPLGADASLDRFSKARAIEHLRILAEEIGGRQVRDDVVTIPFMLLFQLLNFGWLYACGRLRFTNWGSPGLRQAAAYIKKQLELIKERADSKFRIEIEETVVNGSFNMMISSIDSQDSDPSVLLNGHFDTQPGSPGAGDCGSCVASLLELARLTVDSGWLPPRPIIFLLWS